MPIGPLGVSSKGPVGHGMLGQLPPTTRLWPHRPQRPPPLVPTPGAMLPGLRPLLLRTLRHQRCTLLPRIDLGRMPHSGGTFRTAPKPAHRPRPDAGEIIWPHRPFVPPINTTDPLPPFCTFALTRPSSTSHRCCGTLPHSDTNWGYVGVRFHNMQKCSRRLVRVLLLHAWMLSPSPPSQSSSLSSSHSTRWASIP